MRAVAHSAALPDQVPYAAAAAFAEAKAFLCSREARQMRESDLERELHRRGQELVHKLLQGHLEQRSPREAAGPVEGADEEALEAHGDGGRRLHGRAVGAEPGGVPAEPDAPTAGGQDPARAASPRGETGLDEPRTGAVGGGRRGDAGSRGPGPRAGQALGSRSSRAPRRSSTSSQRAPPPTAPMVRWCCLTSAGAARSVRSPAFPGRGRGAGAPAAGQRGRCRAAGGRAGARARPAPAVPGALGRYHYLGHTVPFGAHLCRGGRHQRSRSHGPAGPPCR